MEYVPREGVDKFIKSKKMENTDIGNGFKSNIDGMIDGKSNNINHNESKQQPANMKPKINQASLMDNPQAVSPWRLDTN